MPWKLGLCLAGALGCASPAEVTLVTVETVSGAATYASVDTSELAPPGAVVALAGGDGALHAGTEDGLHRYGFLGWEDVEVLALEGEPTTTGVVADVMSRGDGVFVRAEQGLFYSEEGVLIPSNLLVGFGELAVLDVAVDGQGADEVAWVATEDGVRRIDASGADIIAIPGVTDLVKHVAAADGVVALATGSRVFAVDTATLIFDELQAEHGLVHGASGGGGAICIATDGGVLERDASGVWRLYVLEAPVFEARPDGQGGCVAAQPEGVLQTASGAVGGFALDVAPERLGVDPFGQIWSAGGGDLTVLQVGDPPSFADDVAPLLSDHCSFCHAGGVAAPERDFGDYGEVAALGSDIFVRVNSMQMPPGGLDAEPLEILNAWFNAGMMP